MNTNPPPFLQANQVSKRYGKKQVLIDLNLSLKPNTFFALLGDNGAGKSTLIRLLLGIEQPETGSLALNGTPCDKLTPADFAQIGFVSATQRLPTDKSLDALSRLQQKLYPIWDSEWIHKQAEHLEVPIHTSLGRLSRGQAMKAKLLLGLAHKPSLVLLDEPFDSLDVLVREECIRLLIDWMNTEGGSALMSSHEIDEVEQLADRVGILRNGVFTHEEPLAELLERHRRITYRSEQPPGQIPDHCLQLQHAGRSGSFIETNYKSQESEIEYTEFLTEASSIQTHPMSLKEIYVAIARESRSQKTGGLS